MYQSNSLVPCNNFNTVAIQDIILPFQSGQFIENTSGTLYPYYNSNGVSVIFVPQYFTGSSE